MRRVVDARAVLGVQIVVVLRRRGAPRVRVALAELIVLRVAERVAQTPSPEALPRSLLEDERRRVILATAAGGRLLLQDVAELGERTQQLTALDRRARAELTGRGNAEERIGNRLSQLRRIPTTAQRE